MSTNEQTPDQEHVQWVIAHAMQVNVEQWETTFGGGWNAENGDTGFPLIDTLADALRKIQRAGRHIQQVQGGGQ